MKRKEFWKNLVKFKIPTFLILSLATWFISGRLGFPIWWQIEFVAFVFVGLLIFILLDLPPMEEEKSSKQTSSRLFAVYALPSILFITVTGQLPQFDPSLELKIFDENGLPEFTYENDPKMIAAGREIFEANKCFNCHKVFWEGNSDRGPNLGTKQICLYSREYIKEQIIDPRAKQSPGFDDPKSQRAMPDYYDDDLNDIELKALVAYLKTLRDPTNIPVEGKLGDQWTWWDDRQILKEGQLVFEGKEPATEG
ncbi:MAG: c-type cytochrome, partial [Nitrospinales bacterium]